MTDSAIIYDPHVQCSDHDPLEIRLIWSGFIEGIIGAKGPFSRPLNPENTELLISEACKLFPNGIPKPHSKWVPTTGSFVDDVAKLLATLTV